MPETRLPCSRFFAAAFIVFASAQASAQSALEPQETASFKLMIQEVIVEPANAHPLLSKAKLQAINPPLKRSSWSRLHPHVRRTLRAVEKKFGRPVTVTSGCRSRKQNRRVGGAPRSLHLECKAADFKVAGVSKRQLVRFVRSLPGRGGVGTYCRNSIVHVDTGPRRDWYQRCR